MKFILFFLLCFSSLVAAGQDLVKEDSIPPTKRRTPREDVPFIAESLHEFPGGDEAFRQFLADNLRYPKRARRKKIEGRVVAEMLIENDGSLTNITIIEKVHPDLDKEVIRLLSSMPKWIPNKHRNPSSPRIKHTIPVVFELPAEKKEDPEHEEEAFIVDTRSGALIPSSAKEGSTVSVPVECLQEFPGGKEAMKKFFADNIRYPEEARKAGIEGRVVAQVIFDPFGKPAHIKIVQKVYPDLDREVIRVLSSMPHWTVYNSRKRMVIGYSFPFHFRLTEVTSEDTEAEIVTND